jgi:hypothetical protein
MLSRVTKSVWTHASERARALLEIQLLYARSGQTDKSIAVGWQLQAVAPPGDRSAETGLRALASVWQSGVTTSTGSAPFSDAYRRFAADNPGCTDPTREIALAQELERENQIAAARSLYEKVIGNGSARRADHASAMLGLERLYRKSGEILLCVEAGLAIQKSLPEDLGTRFASFRLMRGSCAAIGLEAACQAAGESLAEELRSNAQSREGNKRRSAQALLSQYLKDQNLK